MPKSSRGSKKPSSPKSSRGSKKPSSSKSSRGSKKPSSSKSSRGSKKPSSPKSSRGSKKPSSIKLKRNISKKYNEYHNVELNPIRQRFYNNLMGIEEDYLKNFFKFTIYLNEYYKDVVFKYKRYEMTFKPYENDNYIMNFGGAVFYMLYFEMKHLGLINSEDEKILDFFFKYKTIDIDAMALYQIKPSIKSTHKDWDSVKKNFSSQYQDFFIRKFLELSNKHLELGNFFSFLVDKREFRGLKFGNSDNIITNIMDGYSINMEVIEEDDSFELRPQLNSCINDNLHCDHIVEILTQDINIGRIANLYKLKTIESFYGMNILQSCGENITRLYRDIFIGDIPNLTIKKVVRLIKDKFSIIPLSKIKYLQGFHRVQLIQLIVSKLLLQKSSKLNYLKKIFLLPDKVLKDLKIKMIRGDAIYIFLNRKQIKENKDFFEYLDKKDEKDRNLEDINQLLLILINTWIIINDKILSLYNQPDEILMDYRVVPAYSSNNNNNNRLYKRVGLELNIDFDDSKWEENITNKEINIILERIFGEKRIVNESTKSLYLKKIKRKLNLINT